MKKKIKPQRLPAELKPLFWEYDFEKLSWAKHRDFIIGKVLDVGTWNDVRWMRTRVDNDELKKWIVDRKGRGLSPQQITFWQLILKIPKRMVDAWLKSQSRKVWDNRVSR